MVDTMSETGSPTSARCGWTEAAVAEVVIDSHRFASHEDRVLALWDGEGASETVMPSCQELVALGVDVVALAEALQNGLDPAGFGQVLGNGLDIPAFNLEIGGVRNIAELNEGMEHLIGVNQLLELHPDAEDRVLHHLHECSCYGSTN